MHFETPNAIARVVLFGDELAPPLGGPVVEVCAVAKRDLKAGEVLDEYGMYMTYGEAVNVDGDERAAGTCPRVWSRAAGCGATSPRTRCSPTTTSSCPTGRLADRLRAEQYRHFRGETWLEDLVAGVARRAAGGIGKR